MRKMLDKFQGNHLFKISRIETSMCSNINMNSLMRHLVWVGDLHFPEKYAENSSNVFLWKEAYCLVSPVWLTYPSVYYTVGLNKAFGSRDYLYESFFFLFIYAVFMQGHI